MHGHLAFKVFFRYGSGTGLLGTTVSAIPTLSLYFRGPNCGRIKSTDLKLGNTGFLPVLCSLMWLMLLECITAFLQLQPRMLWDWLQGASVRLSFEQLLSQRFASKYFKLILYQAML